MFIIHMLASVELNVVHPFDPVIFKDRNDAHDLHGIGYSRFSPSKVTISDT